MRDPEAAERASVLRRRPEMIFLPAVIAAILTSFTDLGQAAIGPAVIRRLDLVTPDRILPFTLAAAVLSGLAGFLIARRDWHLDAPRSVLVAVSIPVGAVGAFEIPYQLFRAQISGASGPGGDPWLALLTWVLVGLTPIGFWRIGRRTLLLLGAIAAGFVLWWAVGYPQATSVVEDQMLIGYLFNVPLKLAAFAVFTLLLWEGRPPVIASPSPGPSPSGRTDREVERSPN